MRYDLLQKADLAIKALMQLDHVRSAEIVGSLYRGGYYPNDIDILVVTTDPSWFKTPRPIPGLEGTPLAAGEEPSAGKVKLDITPCKPCNKGAAQFFFKCDPFFCAIAKRHAFDVHNIFFDYHRSSKYEPTLPVEQQHPMDYLRMGVGIAIYKYHGNETQCLKTVEDVWKALGLLPMPFAMTEEMAEDEDYWDYCRENVKSELPKPKPKCKSCKKRARLNGKR